ncbi:MULTISPECIES: MBL fold metallo-hydrolase [Acetobacter]|uniref:MBL fold metallo-hydrolase n=2 Tax=Acetobacter TaxID=434 RepID=A0AAN1PGJ9_9PROT|nr:MULTISPECIES: MBL fold metallo-hydrolase [Acetobacter]ASL40898.1 MBL fold metallo-hydrolase [Acetobacter oryzifermentans]AXM99756.1 MBL fold metallo-hydrolase [Acetobacter pomorum]KAA8391883.1 MBL fold metallo-hydrolase [Acetobacter sp. DmW_125124]KAA8393718.1 MBL fold metallo-hydrolase [Acetobacter sp. DmW_125127]KAA8394365.1 MBL fold metallo-hydrolase [Acetobacter sp. DmW_125128]
MSTSNSSPYASRFHQGQGFYSFSLGNFTVTSVSDGFLVFDDPQAALAPKANSQEFDTILRKKFLSSDTAYTHINTLLIEGNGKKVLIDNGCGDSLGPSTGVLVKHLANAGVKASEIDIVLVSHAHPDHIFGTITRTGEHVFPNAHYMISKEEWDFWTDPNVKISSPFGDEMARAAILGAQRHLKAIEDRVSFFDSEQEIMPGIRAIRAFGHTPGMMAFIITSNRKKLIYTADALHHFVVTLARPDWELGVDNDPVEAIVTRMRLLEKITSVEAPLVHVPHFPFPGIGHIRKEYAGYVWEPVVWEW